MENNQTFELLDTPQIGHVWIFEQLCATLSYLDPGALQQSAQGVCPGEEMCLVLCHERAPRIYTDKLNCKIDVLRMLLVNSKRICIF